MSDWQSNAFAGHSGVITTAGPESQTGQMFMTSAVTTSTAAWPAANRALYCPIVVQQTVTVYQMSFVTGASAGNYDIGIYEIGGARIVSTGSTAVPAAGLALADITNTTLTPGVYFLALVCSTITTLTVNRYTGMGAEVWRACGLQQENLGATTLPSTATFASPATDYVPYIAAHLNATV